MFEQVSSEVGGRKLTLETGKMARQAHGTVVARYGDTVVRATGPCGRPFTTTPQEPQIPSRQSCSKATGSSFRATSCSFSTSSSSRKERSAETPATS